MSKHKIDPEFRVCQCYDKYGESSPECEWGFTATHNREIYCDACKPIAKKIRVRQAVARHRADNPNLEVLTESTDREWLASWIDKTCTCCRSKGVPTFNRFLCYNCWTNADYIEYATSEPQRVVMESSYEEEPPSAVIVYSSKDMTQDELKALLQN